jgi:monofunctional biosynthetic peptidoglycan transglycosylase
MLRKIFRFLKKACAWFLVLSVLLVILFRFIPVPFTPLMAARAMENIKNDKELEFSHDWVSIDNISPNMQKAVIASEDANFMHHCGFDFAAMQKAYKNNEKGRRIKGGSTITQQTAKNVFLWQGRSYIRKAFEAYFTVLIELFWPKKRIMEVYLNSIEMGGNVYGVEAAAHHWYQIKAYQLTTQQAAGIAAILPNPRKFKAKNSTGFIERRKGRIAKHMKYIKLDYNNEPEK